MGLHFPSVFNSKEVIIVEDVASAEKMDKYFPCVAILGTNLNEEKLSYLLSLGVKRVILALDNDATRKSIKLARRFVVDTQILPLARDLKDETEERLEEIADKLKGE